jgi:hypothetical protein
MAKEVEILLLSPQFKGVTTVELTDQMCSENGESVSKKFGKLIMDLQCKMDNVLATGAEPHLFVSHIVRNMLEICKSFA